MVKILILRVCSNTLPTKANLFKKKISKDALCPICGLLPETVDRILWSCKSAVAVWMECKAKIQKLSIVANEGFHLFERFVKLLDDVDLEFALFLARCIWLRRNFVIFSGVFLSPA